MVDSSQAVCGNRGGKRRSIMTSEVQTLNTILDPETCVQKGLCPVAKGRASKTRQLYYELHGDPNGSQKIVMIMGLNFTCSAWSEQVHYFSKKPDHAVLVFDNRGVGNSDCGPIEPYKTSELAKDTIDLLDFLGWDQGRSLHVFGVSLGGMIAQELCPMIPSRIKSVSFISTRSGKILDFPSAAITKMAIKMALRLGSHEEELNTLLDCLYPAPYLEEVTSNGWTQRKRLLEYFKTWHNFPRKASPCGVFGQFCAAIGHYSSDRHLENISAALFPAKIAVMSGDRDELVYSLRSLQLQDQLPGSELIMFEGAGHALSSQFAQRFNALMERIMMEANLVFSEKKNFST